MPDKDYSLLWAEALRLIQSRVDDWTFTTWFVPVTFESYDPAANVLQLRVPVSQVCDFIEHYYVRLIYEALKKAFGHGVTLQYRILANAGGQPIDFLTTPQASIPSFLMPEARIRMETELRRLYGDRTQWLSGYDRVAQWLADNRSKSDGRGRGLFLFGGSGTGKTTLVTRILPAVFQRNLRVVSAADLYDILHPSAATAKPGTSPYARKEELLRQRALVIDDMGREPLYRYKNRDTSILDILDLTEQRGLLLIIATSLSPQPCPANYPAASWPFAATIADHYGEYGPAILDRLHSVTTAAMLWGQSLRTPEKEVACGGNEE